MVVFLDLESWPFSRGTLAPKPVVAALAVDDGDPWLERLEDVDWSFLARDIIVGANVAYDTCVLIRHFPELRPAIFAAYREGRILDVQHAARLTDIADGAPISKSYSLEALTARYFGRAMDKDSWRLRYGDLDGIPLEYWPVGAVQYPLDDIRETRAVWDHVVSLDSPNLGFLGHVGRAAWALKEASNNGVPAHKERTEQFIAKLDRYLAQAEKRLRRCGLIRTELSRKTGLPSARDGKKDENRAREYMARIHPGGKEGAKGASLDAESALASGSRLMHLFCVYGSANTLRARARNMLGGVGSTMHPSYWVLKETYRTSATQGDLGFQVQNVTKAKEIGADRFELRSVPCPGVDELFIQADFAQAELFSLSQVCYTLFGFSVMGDLLKQGLDVHIHFACQLLGCTLEDYQALPKAEQKKYRTLGKVVNFGLPGGLGAEKLVVYAWTIYKLKISLDEAKRLIAVWKSTFPEAKLYLEWIGQQSERSTDRVWSEKYQKTFGVFTFRHPITGYVRGRVGFPDGANTGFQHLTAYGALTALSDVVEATYDPTSPLFGFKIWGFIHDEILGRGPAARASAAAKEMARIMPASYLGVVPDYPITAPPAVSSVWSKDMEAKYSPGGELLDWATST